MRLTPIIVVICVIGLLLVGLVKRDQEAADLKKKINRLERQLDILRNYVGVQFSKLNTNSVDGIQILDINWETGNIDGVTNSEPSEFVTDD